jgi:predicted transcriptional regulator of viral defense system
MEENFGRVRLWIEALPKMGRMTFSQEDVQRQFPDTPIRNIQNVLFRQVRKGAMQSVWHGFYAIVPNEYGLKGIVPPIEYIDALMKHLHRSYYIGLLSAASYQGASHQQPQELFVVAGGDALRSKAKNDVKINFTNRKEFPERYISTIDTASGQVNISSPELTAFDLVQYESRVGGLDRAATVLAELIENVDFKHLDADFLGLFNSAVIQRLGYLLDNIVDRQDLADTLLERCISAGIAFHRRTLAVSRRGEDIKGFAFCNKWNIIINREVEADV